MGMVFEAVHSAIGKRVAMKFVTSEMAHNKDAVARFLREAQAASAVESGHIVEIFDTGEDEEGRPYLVMELLRGESLAGRLERQGTLSATEAMRVLGQLLRGLVRAHEAGIVHRDLKPDNVFLVERDGESSLVKLLDFGISKVQRSTGEKLETLTREGAVLGTPHYMSPEQAQGLPDVDHQTDLWAVGAIAFECLTGRLAFEGTTYEQVIVSICTKPPPEIASLDPSIPAALSDLIRRALTQDRAQRIRSAIDFLDALSEIAPDVVPARADRSLAIPAAGSAPRAGAFDETVAAGSGSILATDSGLSRIATGSHAASKDSRSTLIAAGVLLVAGLATMGALMWSSSDRGRAETSSPEASSAGAEPAVVAETAPPPDAVEARPHAAGDAASSQVTAPDPSAAVAAASAPRPSPSTTPPPPSKAPPSKPPPYKPPPSKPPPSKPPPSKPPPSKPPVDPAEDLTLQKN
jgi:eukaryotic-like serine/threonine-protein kinase